MPLTKKEMMLYHEVAYSLMQNAAGLSRARRARRSGVAQRPALRFLKA